MSDHLEMRDHNADVLAREHWLDPPEDGQDVDPDRPAAGLTLRELYAGLALAGLLASRRGPETMTAESRRALFHEAERLGSGLADWTGGTR